MKHRRPTLYQETLDIEIELETLYKCIVLGGRPSSSLLLQISKCKTHFGSHNFTAIL